MPFKSQSQRAKFGELVSQGKMKQSTFDEFNKETPENIPDKVAPKTPGQKTQIGSVKDLLSFRKGKYGI